MLVFGIFLVFLSALFFFDSVSIQEYVQVSDADILTYLIGMFILIFAFYYIMAGIKDNRQFTIWTLYTRTGAFFVLVSFVLFDVASSKVLLFWIPDFIGVMWTGMALKFEKK